MSRVIEGLREALNAARIRDARLLVAVSGGADSMALLCGLLDLAHEFQLRMTAAHLDHALRDNSAADVAWLAAQCHQLGVSFISDRQDVGLEAARLGRGIEETARDVRYAFLERIAAAGETPYVAVGHTADDQAETILHNLLRGTGLGGLRGMPSMRPLGDRCRIFRPLLGVSRAEVELYLQARGRTWRVDESNSNPAFTRNRLRGELLPLLRKEFNPRISEILVTLGRQAGEVQELVAALADELLAAAILDEQPQAVRLDCTFFRGRPPHLIRECFKILWTRRGWPRRLMGYREWDRLAMLATAEPNAPAVMLPGEITARRRAGTMVLTHSSGDM